MAKRDKYHPDYQALYPSEEITPEVMKILRESDRKMKYMEVELKQGTYCQNLEAKTAMFIPSREDSLERMQEEEKTEFASAAPSPEDEAIHKDELCRLRKALEILKPDERELIVAIYYEGFSEHQLAARFGIPQTTINYRKTKALISLKELFLRNF